MGYSFVMNQDEEDKANYNEQYLACQIAVHIYHGCLLRLKSRGLGAVFHSVVFGQYGKDGGNPQVEAVICILGKIDVV